MSRKTAIGKNWIEKYTADVYPHGKVVVNGKEVPPPKYYDRYHKKKHPRAHQQMVNQRLLEAHQRIGDNTNQRLAAKETVLEAKINKLKRTL